MVEINLKFENTTTGSMIEKVKEALASSINKPKDLIEFSTGKTNKNCKGLCADVDMVIVSKKEYDKLKKQEMYNRVLMKTFRELELEVV